MSSTQSTSKNLATTKVTTAPAPINGIAAMGVAGALVTGSVAAAREFRNTQTDDETKTNALAKVGKEALGGGIAWAAGAAVAKTLFRSNILGIVAMVAVSAGVKYAYDGLLAPKEAKAVEGEPAKAHKTK